LSWHAWNSPRLMNNATSVSNPPPHGVNDPLHPPSRHGGALSWGASDDGSGSERSALRDGTGRYMIV
jgi:hypothetical protein